MLFNSYIFILAFLPLTLAGYFLLHRARRPALAKIFLLGMSLWFYGYFHVSYLLLLIVSILGNYAAALPLTGGARPPVRRLAYALGLLLDFGLLFVFKYYDFFTGSLNAAFSAGLPMLRLLLPLGISFFTFQQASFLIDAWHGKSPRYSLLDYALFVSFFPQLIAGPIVRHDKMIPQFNDPALRRFSAESFSQGLTGFALGLSKKVLLADAFGRVVDAVYGNAAAALPGDALLAMLCYTMQIYFDFSGYCDMAAGVGYMFRITLPQNFDSPYRAQTLAEFWRRWHQTLTAFFTEYLYIPLGGSRRGKLRTAANVLAVFAVSGLWHGANWTFILWGVLHGIGVALSQLAGRPKTRAGAVLSWALTFAFLNATWVVFRADSLAQAGRILSAVGRAVSAPGLHLSETVQSALPFVTLAGTLGSCAALRVAGTGLLLGAAGFLALGAKNAYRRMEDFRPHRHTAWATALLLVACICSLSQVSTFLYFNF